MISQMVPHPLIIFSLRIKWSLIHLGDLEQKYSATIKELDALKAEMAERLDKSKQFQNLMKMLQSSQQRASRLVAIY